ncbi:MAG: thiamine pyrophosphate-dependent enzyme [Armatimonadota bacterium]
MPDPKLWRKALFIRRFEETLLELFQEGLLHGTVHTCIGQEWSGIAVADALREGDLVFSNHRGHGHYLARGGDPGRLLAEIMGRETGVCSGIGGSQHLFSEGFISNGIQGGCVPIAAGLALARTLDADDAVTAVFIGDGTLGQGVLYETLNIASNWDLPLLVVVENNRIAQTTPASDTVAGSVEARAAAFALDYECGTTRDPEDLLEQMEKAVREVRERSRPLVFEVLTDRLMPHSKSDDTRDAEEIGELRSADTLSNRLERGELADVDEMIRSELQTLVEEAQSRPCADPEAIPAPMYPAALTHARAGWEAVDVGTVAGTRVSDRINGFFRDLMERDERIVMLGEDIEAPYGGAFKITRGLSEMFPGRVRNTPISEAALAGLGTGLALGGFRPIVEIMFGDFLTLCLDQLLNHACKFEFMSNCGVEVPLVMRTPMGGYRGYGPTHSQSIEKHFLGIPYLTVAALNYRLDPASVYDGLLSSTKHPLLVIENKIDYTRRIPAQAPVGYRALATGGPAPTLRIAPDGLEPDVTIACYGGMLAMAEQAADVAFGEHEIICEIVCPTLIHPTDIESIAESVTRSGRLLTLEEGTSFAAWSSEVIASLASRGGAPGAVGRVASDVFVPTCRQLEDAVLPGVANIVAQIVHLMEE